MKCGGILKNAMDFAGKECEKCSNHLCYEQWSKKGKPDLCDRQDGDEFLLDLKILVGNCGVVGRLYFESRLKRLVGGSS